MSVSPGERVKALLGSIGQLYLDDHVVLKSGMHSSAYVNHRTLTNPEHADAFRTFTELVGELLSTIDLPFQALVGPETFGRPMCQWSVYQHNRKRSDRQLFCVPALKRIRDKVEDSEAAAQDPEGRGEAFWIPQPFFGKMRGVRCLISDDVLTTSATAHELIPTIRRAGGICDGLVVSCDRSGKTAQELDLPAVWSLFNVDAPLWTADECPLCKAGQRVNTQVGHGAEFMLKKAQPPTP